MKMRCCGEGREGLKSDGCALDTLANSRLALIELLSAYFRSASAVKRLYCSLEIIDPRKIQKTME